MPLKQPVSEDLVVLAHRLAEASGEIIRRYFRADFHIEVKGDASPVTIADQESEKAIRAILKRMRPGDGIHGEEFGSKDGSTGYLWVLDPVDGTKAFAAGRPLFGTLIGLFYEGAPVLGVLDQPISKERWIGARGHGTTLNGKQIRCRPCADISAATIATTGPDMFDFDDYLRFFKGVCKKSAFSLYGGDCYSYGQLAGGWLDSVVEGYMKLHDYAALIPIVEEAGGIITDWQGRPLPTARSYDPAAVIACGDRRLHEQICAVLAG